MAPGPKTARVELSGDERVTLQRLIRRRGAGQAAVMRARIVLLSDAEPGLTNKAIAARLSISRQNIITWRQRFLAHRLDGLVDAPRSGAPRQVRSHLAGFVDAYNYARRLKTFKGLTPYEVICRAWTKEPTRFNLDPLYQMPGLNI